jgi:transcriptional regulator with XRE-family HTH domain
LADLITADRTRTSSTTEAPTNVSRTRTIDELVEDVGHLRNVTRLLGDDVEEASRRVSEVHHQAFQAQLNSKARDMAKRPATEMLDELAGRGFAWRDIARLVGVSVPAVRRWRQGESPTGPHLLAIARLFAFIEILRIDHLIYDVAAWLEMPLVPEAPMTGIDMAVDGHFVDLLDLATGHETPEAALDHWQPGWRERSFSEFEIFEAADGELGLRPISRGDD